MLDVAILEGYLSSMTAHQLGGRLFRVRLGVAFS